jgi:hypothetical protein
MGSTVDTGFSETRQGRLLKVAGTLRVPSAKGCDSTFATKRFTNGSLGHLAPCLESSAPVKQADCVVSSCKWSGFDRRAIERLYSSARRAKHPQPVA